MLNAAVAVDLGIPLMTRYNKDFKIMHAALTVIAV